MLILQHKLKVHREDICCLCTIAPFDDIQLVLHSRDNDPLQNKLTKKISLLLWIGPKLCFIMLKNIFFNG